MASFISPKFKTWHPSISASSVIEGWDLPYATFDHVEALFSKAKSKHERADVIVNLKRCVDSRVRHLDSVYRFKKLPLASDLEGIYDRMIHVGLLRPVMLGKLYDIRNAIEHRDDDPPDRLRCEELFEFAWYFLRSTDRAAQNWTSLIALHERAVDQNGYWLEISYPENPNDHVHFRGWVPAEFLSHHEKSGYFRIDLESAETKRQYVERMKLQPPKSLEHVVAFQAEDVYLSASTGDATLLQSLYAIYFKVN